MIAYVFIKPTLKPDEAEKAEVVDDENYYDSLSKIKQINEPTPAEEVKKGFVLSPK